MEQVTFVGGMPHPITIKEAVKNGEEITKRVEEWKKKILGGKQHAKL